jgi:glycosidase
MKKLFVVFFSLVLLSCSKNDDNVTTGLSTDPAQYGTPFSGVPSAPDASIYQVNMRAFSVAGNLAGVTARLDSIKALGVNVVYLMPIYPVGTVRSVNSPYAIKDYKAVASEFGSLDDLRTLVDGAHQRGMAVLLDWVANHTAWDHPWLTEHKSWYKQDASGNVLSPAGFTDVAQLNFNNDSMRTAMIEALRYWVLTANVDGYRCDFADNVPFDFWKQAIASLRSISSRKLLMFAEGSRADHFTAGFDMKFGFAFYSKLKDIYANRKSATEITGINESEYANAKDESRVVRYITNHDVNLSDGTPQQLFNGTNGSLAAFVVAAYMKGVPMIYNGQEIAYSKRISYFQRDPITWTPNPAVTEAYKKILSFRNSSEAIRRGQLFSYNSDDVVAFSKQKESEKVFVLVNLRNRAVDYILPAAFANSTWTDALNSGTITLTTKMTLPANGYLVLKQS